MSDFKFLIIPFLVTLVSQFIKCLLDRERRGGIITFLDLSGGMPSSHSAFVSSLTTCIFFKYGVKSPIFAMCLAFSLIILYDARMVRYESGKQAIVLNEIIKRDGIKKDFILKEKNRSYSYPSFMWNFTWSSAWLYFIFCILVIKLYF